MKALASCGHTLVSTGTVRTRWRRCLLSRDFDAALTPPSATVQDERVLVYDLKRRSEYGTLLQHQGSLLLSMKRATHTRARPKLCVPTRRCYVS